MSHCRSLTGPLMFDCFEVQCVQYSSLLFLQIQTIGDSAYVAVTPVLVVQVAVGLRMPPSSSQPIQKRMHIFLMGKGEHQANLQLSLPSGCTLTSASKICRIMFIFLILLYYTLFFYMTVDPLCNGVSEPCCNCLLPCYVLVLSNAVLQEPQHQYIGALLPRGQQTDLGRLLPPQRPLKPLLLQSNGGP